MFEIVGLLAVCLFGAAAVDSALADDLVKLVNSVANLATVALVVWLGSRTKKTRQDVLEVKQQVIGEWDGKDRRNETDDSMDS